MLSFFDTCILESDKISNQIEQLFFSFFFVCVYENSFLFEIIGGEKRLFRKAEPPKKPNPIYMCTPLEEKLTFQTFFKCELLIVKNNWELTLKERLGSQLIELVIILSPLFRYDTGRGRMYVFDRLTSTHITSCIFFYVWIYIYTQRILVKKIESTFYLFKKKKKKILGKC